MHHDSFTCQETLTAYTLCCTTDQCNRCGLPATLPLDRQHLVPRPPGCPPILPPSMAPAATPTETIGSTPIAGKCRKGKKDCSFGRSIELLYLYGYAMNTIAFINWLTSICTSISFWVTDINISLFTLMSAMVYIVD